MLLTGLHMWCSQMQQFMSMSQDDMVVKSLSASFDKLREWPFCVGSPEGLKDQSFLLRHARLALALTGQLLLSHTQSHPYAFSYDISINQSFLLRHARRALALSGQLLLSHTLTQLHRVQASTSSDFSSVLEALGSGVSDCQACACVNYALCTGCLGGPVQYFAPQYIDAERCRLLFLFLFYPCLFLSFPSCGYKVAQQACCLRACLCCKAKFWLAELA